MSERLWNQALAGLKTLHAGSPVLQAFSPFPSDLVSTDYAPRTHPTHARFTAEDFGPSPFDDLIATLIALGDCAHWRQTYKGTDIGEDFMRRFGCYCLIGPEARWTSESLFAFLVYMPPDLWYTWHHHPAEELYLVIGGSGTFYRQGEPVEQLFPSEASFHASNQPHALETDKDPVLALVFWRNHFDTPPVLTPKDMLT